jgi:hypothetical protein
MANDKPNTEPSPVTRPIAEGVAIAAGIVAVILRIVPHPTNFSAVGGLGIFGGARLTGWRAYLLPLLIMVVSDLCLWVVTGFDFKYLADLNRIPVYVSFMIYVAIGRMLAQRRTSAASILLAATIGGAQFFVISNFFDWLLQPFQPYYALIPEFFQYSRDSAGLTKCFAVALGFYQQETPAVDHPFSLVTNFPGALLVWPMLADFIFTTIYLYGYTWLVQRSRTTEEMAAPIASARGA